MVPRGERRIVVLPRDYKFARPAPGQSQWCLVHAPPTWVAPWHTLRGRRRPLKRSSLKGRMSPWRICKKCAAEAPLTPALLPLFPPVIAGSFTREGAIHKHLARGETPP